MCFMIIVILKTNTTIEVYNPFPMINPYTIKLVNVAPIAAAVEETASEENATTETTSEVSEETGETPEETTSEETANTEDNSEE